MCFGGRRTPPVKEDEINTTQADEIKKSEEKKIKRRQEALEENMEETPITTSFTGMDGKKIRRKRRGRGSLLTSGSGGMGYSKGLSYFN
tara:strand:- start:1214 stop:1480 length:267 start_codon:yes stop_codon:yes gene_type:complete